MAFAEDLSVFFDLGGFAVQATWGSLTANVIFQSPDEDLFSGSANGVDFTATLAADKFPGIKRGDTITIAGKGTFSLREGPRMIDDGSIKQLALSSV